MQVETYEVEEITNELGKMAADSEAQELIQKLGLEGQRSLLNEETCTRFPYRKMTTIEHAILKHAFPERTPLVAYKEGIIPIRVLQVAAFVRDFSPSPVVQLVVWHTASAKEDPVLVGHTAEWGGEFYLLARWGDALVPISQLAEKAKVAWKNKIASKIRKEISDWEADRQNLDAIADEFFATGKVSSAKNSYSIENP